MRHPSLVPLSHDHHHGLSLALRCRKQALGQMKPLGAAGLRERADEVLGFYNGNLLAHFRAEEEVLFPSLRTVSPSSELLITVLIDDHRAIGRFVEQLRTASGLARALFELGDLLERHIRKEERELFPIFEREIDAAQAEAIGSEIKRRLEDWQHN
jgi:iron-sulfur cluster repair protein YtfE (RIC family)